MSSDRTHPDPEARELEILSHRVASAVRRVCPAWLSHQAEDIRQQVLLQLLSLRKRTEGERTFSSIYLEKAAYGVTVDEIRRRCRRREVQVEEPGMPHSPESEEAGPERRALSTELGGGIRDCLVKLVRPRRLAVTLYLQGCGVPEAARLLGWGRKRTENLVYRGLADLRGCLRSKGLEP